MNLLELPYIVEFFFAVSTIVFITTLYAILPALVFDKRTFFKPELIKSLWTKIYSNASDSLEKLVVGDKQKETKTSLLAIECEYETVKIYK